MNSLILLLLLSFFRHDIVNCALYHHYVPYIKDNQHQKPYINVTVNRLTSLLIYEIRDIQNTNIPITPNDKSIKRYRFGFTICGLQDLDSGLCSKEQFGLFTVIEAQSMLQPYLNKFLEVGSTEIYELEHSGVWCSLLYQDGDYMFDYDVHSVQFFGNITLEEYNLLQTLTLVILANIVVFIYWASKSFKKPLTREQKQYGKNIILVCSIFSLVYSISIRIYICFISNDNGYDQKLKFKETAALTIASISIFTINYSLYGLFNNSTTNNFKNSANSRYSCSKIFIVLLFFKVLLEYLYRSHIITDPLGFITALNLTIWLFIYKNLLKSPFSRNIKRILHTAPLGLHFIKYITRSISWLISYWSLYRQGETITDKILLVMKLESQVNASLTFSLITNLQQFEYILVVHGLVLLY